MDMPGKDRRPAPAYLAGLARAFFISLCLVCLHLLARKLALPAPDEGRQAYLRLRGALVLVAVAWYGRYVLLPRARWRGWRWLLVPGVAWLALAFWPAWGLSRWPSLIRAVLLLGVYLSLVEQTAATIRRACEVDLGTISARQAAVPAIRSLAGLLSVLIALAAGVSLYLLAIDFVFDYFLYSLFGMAVVLACFLAPLAVVAARLEKAVAPELLAVARREEAALDAQAADALTYEHLARQAIARSGRTSLHCWDWLYPFVSSALLVAVALLHQW